MSQIRDTWEAHPEFFGDFRVLPALVSGLGESYAELAELNMEIMKAQGSQVLPLLKEGFDPAGKKEMARRVEVIAALEGAEATPWLREVLPQAKRTCGERSSWPWGRTRRMSLDCWTCPGPSGGAAGRPSSGLWPGTTGRKSGRSGPPRWQRLRNMWSF